MSTLIRELERGVNNEALNEDLEKVELSDIEFSTVNALLMFIRNEKCEELCIGGESGSSSLLQIHACIDETDNVDIIASFLKPGTDDINNVAAARHQPALNLIAAFWRTFPETPLLMADKNGDYGHVVCGLEAKEETWAPFSLSQWRTLRRVATGENERVAFAKPAQQQDESRVYTDGRDNLTET